jgi:hypothetical protein
MKKLPDNEVRKERPVRFTDQEWEIIKKLAKKKNISSSKFVQDATMYFINSKINQK